MKNCSLNRAVRYSKVSVMEELLYNYMYTMLSMLRIERHVVGMCLSWNEKSMWSKNFLLRPDIIYISLYINAQLLLFQLCVVTFFFCCVSFLRALWLILSEIDFLPLFLYFEIFLSIFSVWFLSDLCDCKVRQIWSPAHHWQTKYFTWQVSFSTCSELWFTLLSTLFFLSFFPVF